MEETKETRHKGNEIKQKLAESLPNGMMRLPQCVLYTVNTWFLMEILIGEVG